VRSPALPILAKFYDTALLYTYITRETILLEVALYNGETTLKLVLERGADILIYNKNKDIVLYYLAIKGNLYLLTQLLRHLYNIDIRNNNSEILLLYAV